MVSISKASNGHEATSGVLSLDNDMDLGPRVT